MRICRDCSGHWQTPTAAVVALCAAPEECAAPARGGVRASSRRRIQVLCQVILSSFPFVLANRRHVPSGGYYRRDNLLLLTLYSVMLFCNRIFVCLRFLNFILFFHHN